MLVKPSVAGHKVTIDSFIQGNTFQLATSPREVVAILATAKGGALFVSIYDSASGIGTKQDRVTISANQGESTPFTPARGIPFKKGIYIVFEQGGQGQGGGDITLILDSN